MAGLSFPRSYFLLFLKTAMNLAFSQSAQISPDWHNLLRSWKWTHFGQWCIPIISHRLLFVQFVQIFPVMIGFTEGRLLQTFPLVSDALVSRTQISSAQTKAKDTWIILAFSMPFVTQSPAPFSSGTMFSLLFPFSFNVPVDCLFAALHACCQIQFQMYLGFVTPLLHHELCPYLHNQCSLCIATWVYNKLLFKKVRSRTRHFQFSFQFWGLESHSPDL